MSALVRPALDEDLCVIGKLGAELVRFHHRLDEARFRDLFVDPTARRIGVGRALMTATVDALESRGARQFVLSAAVRNTSAQQLFDSLESPRSAATDGRSTPQLVH